MYFSDRWTILFDDHNVSDRWVLIFKDLVMPIVARSFLTIPFSDHWTIVFNHPFSDRWTMMIVYSPLSLPTIVERSFLTISFYDRWTIVFNNPFCPIDCWTIAFLTIIFFSDHWTILLNDHFFTISYYNRGASYPHFHCSSVYATRALNLSFKVGLN